jgi:hypothetical protein
MPALISMTSTGDWGTGVFFPIGQALSRPFNSLRNYPHPNALGLQDQAEMYLKTTAYSKAFVSHLLNAETSTTIAGAFAGGCQVELVSEISGTKYKLIEQPGSKNLSPYWVVQLPKEIVPDHTTIFGAAFRSLMIDLVLSSRDLRPTQYVRR